MEKQHETQFEAFVTNLGKYNEGELVGEWIGFPAEQEELDAMLERIGINEDYEEYFITDYNFEKYPCIGKELRSDGEYENLVNLNLLGKLLEKYGLEEKTEGYITYQAKLSTMELFNVIAQQEEIDYSSYQFDGMEHLIDSGASEESLYGYTITEQNGTYQKLEDMEMVSYIDFEALGRDAAINDSVKLLENGYLSMNTSNVDLEQYSFEELMEDVGFLVEERETDKTIEQTMEEVAPKL